MDIDSRSGAALLEIRRRTRLIVEAIDGLTYHAYLEDQQRQASVERHLEVIGEAFRRLRDGNENVADQVDGHLGFIGLRNVIAHGYDRLVQEKIWEAVTDDLPSMNDQVSRLLNELGEPT